MLDRELQRKILIMLVDVYPGSVMAASLSSKFGDRETIFNLAYLDEHGLTESTWNGTARTPTPVLAKITAKGLDFLSNDGGLSSILGVVTVKLHQETITALFVDRVEKSDAPPSVKKQIIEKVKGLPAEALQRVSLKAMEAGLDRIDVSQWLDKLLGP